MRSHGRLNGRRRYFCSRCRSTRIPTYTLRLRRTPRGWVTSTSTEGLKVWHDDHNRACVTLHPLHPYANSAGYQRVARFLIAEELGYLPPPSSHTHHLDLDLTNDSISNLELIDIAYHGRIHASGVCVGRGADGRFTPLEPDTVFSWPRRGPVLGNSAKLRTGTG